MASTGRFRLIVGGAISSSVPLDLIVPTPVVDLDALGIPAEISAGEAVDLSIAVKTQYSDSEFRPAPDGTTYEIEFAASDEPIVTKTMTLRAGRLWEPLRQARSRAGSWLPAFIPTGQVTGV